MKDNVCFAISLLAAVAFFALASLFNCTFDVRHLPRVLGVAAVLLCSLGIASFCLLVIYFFFKAFGQNDGVHERVVSAAGGWVLVLGIFICTEGLLLITQKYCN